MIAISDRPSKRETKESRSSVECQASQGRIAGSYGKAKLKLLEATPIGIITLHRSRERASGREGPDEAAAAVLPELQDEPIRRSLSLKDSPVERGASDGRSRRRYC